MKNLKSRRFLCLFIVFMMILPNFAYTVLAEDEKPAQEQTQVLPAGGEAAIEDIYSSWAYWDVFMAYSVYGIGNEGTYSNFRGNFVWQKFLPVCEGLNKEFGIDFTIDVSDKDHLVTRGEIISALYEIIVKTLKIDEKVEAVDYFSGNKLINGRKDGDYQLEAACTGEEMIVFSVRVYEYLVYSLDLDAKGFFWKAAGEKGSVYLLGSIHISDGSLYPVKKDILSAFDFSDHLVLEIDFADETEEDRNYIDEIGFIKDGKTIKDYISPELYESYIEICKIFEIPQEICDYLYPWYAQIVFDQISMGILFAGENAENIDDIYDAFGNASDLGIDNYFTHRALYLNKDIMALESTKLQIDMFASFSPELQEALLAGSLYNIYMLLGFAEEVKPEDEQKPEEEQNIGIYDMLAMWKSGDEKSLGELLGLDVTFENPFDIEYNSKMFTERNIEMAKKIIIFLNESDDDYFVIVGAGHMLGEEGIINLLIKAGFTVERIK